MRFVSTRVHGMLDYLAVVLLLLLPQVLPETARVTGMLVGAGIGLLIISFCTRYELSLVRILPMRAHLVLDFLLGVMFLGEALLLREEAQSVRIVLAVLGVLEVGVAIVTRPHSPVEEPESQNNTPVHTTGNGGRP